MLYVKIKSLTDKTTSEYVRDIRLEEAARLLKEGLLNVSEVAFEVGFKDPKYLSKKFKQKFGITPAMFRKGEV
jgi:AraC-like DNA-binding protein